MKNFFTILFLFAVIQAAQAQQATQTIKGTLTDAQSKYPLPGANVVLEGSSPLIGSATDDKGQFRLRSLSG